MRKFLPVLVITILFFFGVPFVTHAQTQQPAPVVPDNTWIIDPEVTFTGKNAARSGLLLDWTLRDYQWASSTAGLQNPIIPFWALIRNLTYALLILFVMATAFILIATRGKSLTFKKVIPRFLWVVILIYLSFSIIAFIYQTFDVVQGFFLRSDINKPCPPTCISQVDLLYVGWQYGPFFGLRKSGDMNAESAFMSLLFVKITSLTYYTMVITLIIRKIILWFFIIVSPIFPLLLFYYPLRNTAKIWVGEFFRWLLYGPLFSIFLAGLVALWRTRIPMQFNLENPQSRIIFPTSINILLGGPGQQVALDNSINNPDTFALYLVALIMLWMVILVPWILLRIFLDHAWSYFTTENAGGQQMLNFVRNRINPPATPPSPIPPPAQPTGTARLPFKQYAIPQLPKGAGDAMQLPVADAIANTEKIRQDLLRQNFMNSEILNMTNLTIPTIRDIAKYETLSRSSDVRTQSEVNRMRDTLVRVANPVVITNPLEREKIMKIRERLVQTQQQGNNVSTSILHAAKIASQSSIMSMNQQINNNLNSVLGHIADPEKVTAKEEKEQLKEIKETLIKESQQGNELATTLLNTKESLKGEKLGEIKEKLIDASLNGDKAATSLLSKAISQVDTGALQNTLTKLDKPETLTNEKERSRFTKVKEKIVQAEQQGSLLAGLIISSIRNTAEKKADLQQMETLKEKLVEAKEKGDLLAVDMLTIIAAEATVITPEAVILPQNNRIQTVSLEDYEAVRKMWEENYRDLDVPEGGNNRKDWISQEVEQIDGIIELLSSGDQTKIQEGMQQVGNILPFLLLGGFTQDEILAYLKAKREAGKAVLEDLKKQEAEEDTLVEVKKKTSTEKATMAQAQAIDIPGEDDESVLDAIEEDVKPTKNMLLEMTNLSVPTLRDIVTFDYAVKTQKPSDVEKINDILIKIINPEQIMVPEEKEKITEIREKLIENSKSGDKIAISIVNACNEIAKERNLPQLEVKKEDGTSIQTAPLLTSNNLQQVSVEDYEAVRKMWIENYQQNEPPSGVERKAWIRQEIEFMTETLNLLASQNANDITLGMQKISHILPMLLLGGFSLPEMQAYLTSKLEAGKFVLEELVKQEDTQPPVVQEQQTPPVSQSLEATIEE